MAQNWSFVAAGTTATGANPAPGVPAGFLSGDLFVLIAGSNATAFGTTPSGYTKAEGAGSNDFCGNLTVYWKQAGGSESAPTVTQSDTTAIAAILAWRGLITTAVDVTGTKATAGTGSVAAGSVTTTALDDLVIHAYTCQSGASTFTAPASTTNRLQVNGVVGTSGILVCDEDQPSAGATTARTGTISISGGIGGLTIAWKQSVASGPVPPTGSAVITGNAPTLISNTFITPQVARPYESQRGILVPSRKIFLPSRSQGLHARV